MEHTHLLYDGLSLAFPESFRPMTREESAQFAAGGDGEGLCLISQPLHIIVSTGRKPTRGIVGALSRLLSGKDLVKNIETFYKKQMRSFGFSTDRYLKRAIGGATADGLRYTYQAQGIDMTGESFALRRQGAIYYFHVYYRTRLGDESRRVWDLILDSAKWND